jgi:hypothetical protein
MIFDDVLPALLCVCIAVGWFAAAAPRLLFRWYLHEARRLEIPPDPGEAVATYPFA